MSNNKRTRSQLTLDEFSFDIGRSPLKDARVARRNNANTSIDLQDHSMPDVESQDEGPLSEKTQGKRPSSPSKDLAAHSERDQKRARVDEGGAEKEVLQQASKSFSRKPSSSLPPPETLPTPQSTSTSKRSQSVPPESFTPVPHLDFARISPSPWKTPSKSKFKLRITSVTPMDTIQDMVASSSADTAGASPMETEDEAGGDAKVPEVKDAFSARLDEHDVMEGIEELNKRTVDEAQVDNRESGGGDVPLPSSPLSPPSSSSPPELHEKSSSYTQLRATTPTANPEVRSSSPSSPLTPIPPTPHPNATFARPESPSPLPQSESTGDLQPPSRPKSPSLTSRLPRPLTSLPAPVASTSETKLPPPKAKPPSRAKSRGPTSIPLGGRTTRSATLRQQEIKKKEEALAAVTDAPKTPGRPSTSLSRLPTNVSRPGTALGSNAPLTSTSDTVKLPPKTPGTSGRRRSMSFSYAMPTSSSAAKSNPSSPTKPHSTLVTNTSYNRIPTFPRSSQPPPNSSLSNLSMALDKLNVPRPARPNTSMGFNRDRIGDSGGDTDDEDEPTTKSTGSKDDSSVGMRSTGSSTNSLATASKTLTLTKSSTMNSLGIAGSSSKGKLVQTKLMLPPAVPKNRLNTTSGSSSSKSTPNSSNPPPANKINLHSGIVAGKAKGNLTFNKVPRLNGIAAPGPLTAAMVSKRPSIFGVGTLTGGMRGSRVIHRVSKESSLPVVEGSPVKGSSGGDVGSSSGPGTMNSMHETTGLVSTKPSIIKSSPQLPMESEENVFLVPSTSQDQSMDHSAGKDEDVMFVDDGPSMTVEEKESEKGKDKEKPPSWLQSHDSRRASMASQLLSQSLSSLPKTPPRVPQSLNGKGKARAASSQYPTTRMSLRSAPGLLGKGTGPGGDGSKVNAGKGVAESSGTIPETNGKGKEAVKQGSLKVLKDCTIFVDVRTDEGDDAGSLFVDMLKGLGAKTLARVGQSCTHIVYKNGLTSTQTRYRLLHEPRPKVVGIAWVVECVEQRSHVDETKFLVDLELVNVAGDKKRRRSMLPKQLTTLTPKSPPSLASPPLPPTAKAGSSALKSDRSFDMTPSDLVADSPAASSTSIDDLPPLERARLRRQSSLFASQRK
ncbi:hypothetical protein ABKN59_002867 [Abortiporus biennis]